MTTCSTSAVHKNVKLDEFDLRDSESFGLGAVPDRLANIRRIRRGDSPAKRQLDRVIEILVPCSGKCTGRCTRNWLVAHKVVGRAAHGNRYSRSTEPCIQLSKSDQRLSSPDLGLEMLTVQTVPKGETAWSNKEEDMKFIKAAGVPLPITLLAALMGIGGTIIGIGAVLDPSTAIDFIDGADKLGTSWGGRNLGLGVASIAAVLLRNSAAYVVAFSGAIWREISDLIAGMIDGGSLNVPFAFVLVLELICLAVCLRATLGDSTRTTTSPQLA